MREFIDLLLSARFRIKDNFERIESNAEGGDNDTDWHYVGLQLSKAKSDIDCLLALAREKGRVGRAILLRRAADAEKKASDATEPKTS